MTVDELEDFGLTHLNDEEIGGFLTSQDVGVLGLEAEDGPYLLPMSYGYDGDSSLYFTFVAGERSRKEELTARTETARFLVYNASSMFVWESVILTGTVREVPRAEWEDLDADEVLDGVWHPEVFEAAGERDGVDVYEFRIDDRVGIKQVGLPPGFEGDAGAE